MCHALKPDTPSALAVAREQSLQKAHLCGKDGSKHCSRPGEAQAVLHGPPNEGPPAAPAVVRAHEYTGDQVIHPLLIIPLQPCTELLVRRSAG